MAAKGKTSQRKGQGGETGRTGRISRRRGNAAYRRANKERAEQVRGSIEAAVAEGVRLRDEISRKIERRGSTAGTEARGKRAPRRR